MVSNYFVFNWGCWQKTAFVGMAGFVVWGGGLGFRLPLLFGYKAA